MKNLPFHPWICTMNRPRLIVSQYFNVFQTVDLAIDESSFTGEPNPSQKTPDCVPKHVSLQNGVTDRTCIAFMGTLVRCGHGKVNKGLDKVKIGTQKC